MSFRGIIIVLSLFVLGVAFSGFAAYSETVVHPKEEVTIDGKKLAAQNCASCHGKDLTGSVGPNLHERGALLTEETIAQVIHDGVNGKMPPMGGGGLKSDKEVEAVAKYIASLSEAK
ncbi:cytochrome c [Tumebacillus sp. ITR2]|uniref:Cytochrome c n=1 Tax=Tumebacillus amylolyticus TaxID=2801339 RepID=A0ABS1JCF6_9BACL|nr:cytochrome c [Tumebacillus amylolyticus]MBL0387953.1 cytochrome c [Tumebacillus amylolyticus]